MTTVFSLGQSSKSPRGYRVVRIPKGNGKSRLIYIPDQQTKKFLRGFLARIEEKLLELDKSKANFAFVKGRNPILNALQHVGFARTLSFDVENFFDSIQKHHIEGLLDEDILKHCLVDGSPRQGLPTSPLIATIAFLSVDERIKAALNQLDIEYVYTRYADDLTISFDSHRDIGKIKFIVNQVVQSNGFRLNPAKTRSQSARNGRRVITGVAIDKDGVYPTRKTKKKLRAALHQGNLAGARGLREWSRCKLPKEMVKSDG